MGVLRNQIGSEGLATVIEYLPDQYTKRMLNSKDARAKYVATVLTDSQRPFIWEYFRPGTIPLAGTDAYYDQVCMFCLTCNISNQPFDRNEEAHFSLSLSSGHSLSSLPPMGSNHQSHPLILVMGVVRLVLWPLQPQL
jgi:hypothetical protein